MRVCWRGAAPLSGSQFCSPLCQTAWRLARMPVVVRDSLQAEGPQ